MSWSDPSQQEAQEAYDAAKQKYDSAAENYLIISRKRDEYDSQAKALYKGFAADDQRLISLRRLEFKLRRVCRVFGTTGYGIDNYVLLSRVYSVELNEAMSKFVSCDGLRPLTVGPSAQSPETGYDSDASRAKQLSDAELARVQALIAELEKQIKTSADTYNDLKKYIKACESEMSKLRKTMDSCAFDMEHYRKFI